MDREDHQSERWAQLKACGQALSATSMRALFASDDDRFAKYSCGAAGLFADFSKNKIDDAALDALIALAQSAELEAARDKMFAGAPINATEGRAVLHVALRDFSSNRYMVNGADVAPQIEAARQKMRGFCARVHNGEFCGYTGKPLRTIVNIGIGGSDLGPLMAVEALRPNWIEGRRTLFVSNVDGHHLSDALEGLDPQTTLFVIASKTFTTQETLTNARSAREWFLANGGSAADIAHHFIALSTNGEAVAEFGIDTDNMFGFWEWVGGRFSLWSSIGMSIALQIGYDGFEAMLRGANEMDEHFRTAPLNQNMPALLALIGIWNRNIIGARAHAILPYDQHLHRFPAYLQQAEMESNGKSVRMDGTGVDCATSPVIFGEPGTNGQHAFYQLLHQGTDLISADFIAAAISANEWGEHQPLLLSNFLAQTEAMMIGKTTEEARADLAQSGLSSADLDALAAHKTFPGDRPTTSILMERLTPETFGALIALYEHKIFCQGVIWGVNSFDQWGVELGKTLAKAIAPKIAGIGETKPAGDGHDSSTIGLMNWINTRRLEAK